MRGRYSEAEILAFLRAAAVGTPVIDICWNHCIRRSTFYGWKARYGALIDGESDEATPTAAAVYRLRKYRGVAPRRIAAAPAQAK